IPSGDLDKDMREIKLYLKDFKGLHPENFTVGEV
ncbi:MAG: acyltransferase, partial [Bacteroidaceae bacterium]|nr:acyltransferase [Bacteroidaceae bacterium]